MKQPSIRSGLNPSEKPPRPEPTPTPRPQDPKFAAIIVKSDRRIKDAIEILSDSERGRFVMEKLKEVFTQANGLDSVGGGALRALVEEFTKNHRRGFLP